MSEFPEIDDGEMIRVDGEKGRVDLASSEGSTDDPRPDRDETAHPETQSDHGTLGRTNDGDGGQGEHLDPATAKRAADTGADSVGLLRTEHMNMIVSTNKTPRQCIDDHGVDAYVRELADGIQTVADTFYPRSVRVRTLDAPTDEFRRLEGGDSEPEEHNPMFGY